MGIIIIVIKRERETINSMAIVRKISVQYWIYHPELTVSSLSWMMNGSARMTWRQQQIPMET